MRFIITVAMLFVAITAIAAPVPTPLTVKAEQVNDHHIYMLSENKVHRELGLSSDQRVKLMDGFEDALEQFGREARVIKNDVPRTDPNELIRTVVSESYRAASAKYRKTHIELITTTLTYSQFMRLQQLERRNLGPFAFREPDVNTALKLTADQRKGITKVLEELVEDYSKTELLKSSPMNIHVLSKPYLDKIVKSLTAQQRETWDQLIGKPAKLQLITSDHFQTQIINQECAKLASPNLPAPPGK